MRKHFTPPMLRVQDSLASLTMGLLSQRVPG